MFKKICALVLAIAMVLAMGSVAMAADNTYTGSGDTNATGVAGKDKIPLVKSIIFFNENGSTVYEPNITFNYAVAPDTNVVEAGTTAKVTDSNNVERNVYPGPKNGVTGTTISFSTAKTASSSATGVEVEETGNLGLDITKFERPGIYRYVITESVLNPSSGDDNNAKLKAAGLTERDEKYEETRYLDVYIHYNSDFSALEMYGAVIFKTKTTTAGQDSITKDTEKTTGFAPTGNNTTYKDDKNVDKYTTYDFSVKKTVSGSMADTTHEFPFYVTVSNSINGAKFTYTADGSETFAGMTVDTGVATLSAANFSIGSDSKESKLTLKHNDTIKLVGVPSAQGTKKLSVVVKEFNDTYDQYTASTNTLTGFSVAKTNNDETIKTGVMTATSGSMETTAFDVYTNDKANQELIIDNNLTEISPTGVVLRVAPYVLILGAGLALLLISRRRKTASEEE